MSYFPRNTKRDAEIAKAESLVKAAVTLLDKYPNPETKLGIMWELAFVHLQSLENWRNPK